MAHVLQPQGDEMATRCTTKEEAEQTANKFLVNWPTPAVVEIRTEQGDLQFWDDQFMVWLKESGYYDD